MVTRYRGRMQADPRECFREAFGDSRGVRAAAAPGRVNPLGGHVEIAPPEPGPGALYLENR
jgi:hypothetical protein